MAKVDEPHVGVARGVPLPVRHRLEEQVLRLHVPVEEPPLLHKHQCARDVHCHSPHKLWACSHRPVLHHVFQEVTPAIVLLDEVHEPVLAPHNHVVCADQLRVNERKADLNLPVCAWE